MAKSKRNKVVALTKTKKSNLLDKKSQFVKKVHSLISNYKYSYSFSYKNLTTLAMQSLRSYFKDENEDSQFLLGKSTIFQVALGRNEEESVHPNMFRLSKTIKGNSGMFFSNKDPDFVINYFDEYTCEYFPTPGQIANQTIIIKKGLPDEFKKFTSSLDPYLRELGVKVKLDGGKFYLLEDYVVCSENKKITAEQVKVMRLLNLRIDEFKIKIQGYCTKEGEVKILNDNDDYIIDNNKNNIMQLD